MKAKVIVTKINELNKLGILKKAVVVKKGKEEDVQELADIYIAAVNTLTDDEISEDVAKFYNDLGDEMDAGTLVEKEEVEEKVVEKKEDKKSDEKIEKKKEDKKASVKKEVKKETVKAEKKPEKVVEKKVDKKKEVKNKKEPSRKFIVYQAWNKKPKNIDKIYELATSLGLSILTAKGWVNQWAKGNNLPAGV